MKPRSGVLRCIKYSKTRKGTLGWKSTTTSRKPRATGWTARSTWSTRWKRPAQICNKKFSEMHSRGISWFGLPCAHAKVCPYLIHLQGEWIMWSKQKRRIFSARRNPERELVSDVLILDKRRPKWARFNLWIDNLPWSTPEQSSECSSRTKNVCEPSLRACCPELLQLSSKCLQAMLLIVLTEIIKRMATSFWRWIPWERVGT